MGTHEPLISRSLWDKVQNILDSKTKKGKQAKWGTKDFAFKGLVECGECHRSISGDRKVKPNGKEYVYYRCTKYKTQCSQKQASETKLEAQIVKALENIKLPSTTVEYVTQALKGSLETKRSTSDRERKRLEDQKSKLLVRLDRLYEDKLDQEIDQAFYDRKFEEYSQKVTDLDSRLTKYTQADLDYYRYGSSMLQLANKAAYLYENANDTEKRELLGYILSNCQLFDKKLQVTYRKPFDTIFKHTQSFRTLEKTVNKRENTLMGASQTMMRTGRDSNPRPPP